MGRNSFVLGGNVRGINHDSKPIKILTKHQQAVVIAGAVLAIISGLVGSAILLQTTASEDHAMISKTRDYTNELRDANTAADFKKLLAAKPAVAAGYTLTVSAPVVWPTVNPGRLLPAGEPKPGRFAVTLRWSDGNNLYACDAATARCLNSTTATGTTISEYEGLNTIETPTHVR